MEEKNMERKLKCTISDRRKILAPTRQLYRKSSSLPGDLDKLSNEKIEGTCRPQVTPRILRAIRRHSGKQIGQVSTEDKSLSIKGDNSKSDVVILYQGSSRELAGSEDTSKTLVRTSKSDQTVVKEQYQQFNHHSEVNSPRSPPRLPPKLLLRRRRPPHRRPICRESLNVNIIQSSGLADTNLSQCPIQNTNNVIRHMAYPVNERLDENKRVFPFRLTPSGNLKVIPNQVVFESKKVSVLVADPRHATVNVKAELNKPEVGIGDTGQPKEFTTPSAIDHYQTEKKLPKIPSQYVPKTQPQRSKSYQSDQMEVKQTNHRHQAGNEVPLASLGFTTEQPIDWDNVHLPEKTDLYEELARRITNYRNADCIVRLGNDEFHCHLLVLQSYSTFFDEKNCKEIDLTGSSVTSRAFSIIYDWMISSGTESCQLLRRDNILEIFTASQFLGIKELEDQCWAFIENEDLFSEDTAFLLYLDAKKIGNTAVMELMIPRIMKFFLMLVSTKDFLELSVEELCLLLRSDYICVNSEMEVLMSAVRWLMYDWDKRKDHLLDVLKCVRFGLIAPWQLVDVKRNPENPEFMELMSYPEVQKMVDDGLAFVIIKLYGNQTEDYYHWTNLLGLSEPANRNWTGEEKNYVSYREFLLYLEEYQRSKLTELKTKNLDKSQTLSNECGESPIRQQINYQTLHNVRTSSSGQMQNNVGTKAGIKPGSKWPRVPIGGGQTASGYGIPVEMLTKCLSSLGNHSKIIKKHSQEENQNAKRVAQLLSIPSINNNNLHQPLEPLRLSNELRATPQPTPRSRKYQEPIKTIHPPEPLDFDERTSSVSQIYDTDTDDTFTPRFENSVNTSEETVLVFGGIDSHKEYGTPGNTGKDIYRYKTMENIWEFIGEMPEPRHHHSLAFFGGRIYLVGGADPSIDPQRKSHVVGSVWSYDVETRSWFNEPALLTPRKNFGLVISQGRMYAIGGQDRNGLALRSVEVFDPSEGTWRSAPPMHTSRIGPACILYDNVIWIGGGMTISKREPISRDVECFDTSKNMWINIEPLRVPRCFATFYVMFDSLYLIGGAGKSLKNPAITESIDTIDVWDAELRVWREFSKITIARHNHSTSSIGNQLLIIGGVTTISMKALRTIDCYCFERSRWIKGVAGLPYSISGHASISLIIQNSSF